MPKKALAPKLVTGPDGNTYYEIASETPKDPFFRRGGGMFLPYKPKQKQLPKPLDYEIVPAPSDAPYGYEVVPKVIPKLRDPFAEPQRKSPKAEKGFPELPGGVPIIPFTREETQQVPYNR